MCFTWGKLKLAPFSPDPHSLTEAFLGAYLLFMGVLVTALWYGFALIAPPRFQNITRRIRPLSKQTKIFRE